MTKSNAGVEFTDIRYIRQLVKQMGTPKSASLISGVM